MSTTGISFNGISLKRKLGYKIAMGLFCERIRKAREAKGLSQNKVAMLINDSQPSYNSIENGKRPVGPKKIILIAKALDIDPGELLLLKAQDDNPELAEWLSTETPISPNEAAQVVEEIKTRRTPSKPK